MDISHVLDAKAILTISKDMVFRDIAQVYTNMEILACHIFDTCFVNRALIA
jgi:hypothetical protein